MRATRGAAAFRRLLGVAAVLATTLLAARAPASSALELVRMARTHESANEADVAVRRYMEALALDATCEEAYLGLGALRARLGDLREADRVYSVALERLPWLKPAMAARAGVRRALGLRAEAAADLFAGATDEVAALRTLAGWYGEDGQLPAQLAVWRRLATIADATGDAPLTREARTMVRALVLVVGPADPAAAPPPTRPREASVREALASFARRGP